MIKLNLRLILCFIGFMCLQSSLTQAQMVTFNLVESGNNVVVLRMTANVSGFTTVPFMRAWSTASFYIKVCPSVNAPFVAGTGQLTGNNTDGFPAYNLLDEFSGTTTPTLTTLSNLAPGCSDDGCFYVHLQDFTSAVGTDSPIAQGESKDLFTMTYPANFQCNNCISLVTADIPCNLIQEAPYANNGRPGYSFNLGDIDANLPIELTHFEPRTDKCDLWLYWETATEQNFGYYQIEGSKDGREFKALAQQKPQSPNSLEKRTYKYNVPKNYQGYYFRLKSVDLDEQFEYSDIVATQTLCDKQYTMQLYPNPNYVQQLTVEISSLEAQEQVQLVILDALGKAILLQKVDLLSGVNKVPIDTENLPSGTYYVRLLGVPQLSEPLKFIRSNF